VSRRTEGSHDVQDRALESLAQAENYNRWLAVLAEPWLGDDVIEIGAGAGSVGALWAARGRSVTLTEPHPDRVVWLRRRFEGAPGIRVEQMSLPTRRRGTFSCAAAINVLEHVRDDRSAVTSMARLVRPGGHVVVLVPAFEVAMSRFDRDIGHHRRYRREGVQRLFESAGLQPVGVRYVNSVGLIGWMLVVRGLRRSPADGALLRFYDRRVVPRLRRWEEDHPPPFGQSVLGVARA
jgi:SAM-dependent methyltransferase